MQEAQRKLTGLGVALATPFDEAGQVDYEAFGRLLSYVGAHVDYYVVNGTTGESPTTTAQEKQKLLAYAQSHNAYGLPIVFGVGGNNTQETVALLNETDLSGVTAILSVSPYYNKPTQEGIYRHYKAVADASPVPVILYNVPPRTGSNVTADTTLRLAKHPNVLGVKEASKIISQCQAIATDMPDDFLLISGDDSMTLPTLAIGGHGVISVGANAFPKAFKEMTEAGLKGDFKAAAATMKRLFRANELLFEEGNPAGVKLALEAMGICRRHVRLPLAPGSDDLRTRLEAAIDKAGLYG